MFLKRVLVTLMITILFISGLVPNKADAALQNNYQIFTQGLSKELNQYIKKSGGSITLHYREFSTGDEFKINSTSAKKAASTIKLPLALYVMELAAAKKIDLNEKLTYKRHHYYGGSGVIQKNKVGTKYTIRDLVKKAMIHSDNIAFIMLRERVGKNNFIAYMKKIGGKNAYPGGQNLTSSTDLVVYATRLYDFSKYNELGKELVEYLKNTDYNTTIPQGIKGVKTAHKVGMIPMSNIYNDIGIVYDKNPFALAVMTNNLSYKKSQKVIADIASIIYKYHRIKNNVSHAITKKTTPVYSKPSVNSTSMGHFVKGESFKIAADLGEMYEIQFGGKKGYAHKNAVYSYGSAPTRGFTNRSYRMTGSVTSIGNAKVLSSPVSNGKVTVSLSKGTSIDVIDLKGDYYTVLIGNKFGYIFRDSVQLQFTASVKYIEIIQRNAEIYSLKEGGYVLMGNLKKGEVFVRTKDAGGFNEVQIGSGKAYIKKKATKPLFRAVIANPAENLEDAESIVLSHEVLVYSNPSENAAYSLGKLLKGQEINYHSLENGWYVINFLGRKGYLKYVPDGSEASSN